MMFLKTMYGNDLLNYFDNILDLNFSISNSLFGIKRKWRRFFSYVGSLFLFYHSMFVIQYDRKKINNNVDKQSVNKEDRIQSLTVLITLCLKGYCNDYHKLLLGLNVFALCHISSYTGGKDESRSVFLFPTFYISLILNIYICYTWCPLKIEAKSIIVAFKRYLHFFLSLSVSSCVRVCLRECVSYV